MSVDSTHRESTREERVVTVRLGPVKVVVFSVRSDGEPWQEPSIDLCLHNLGLITVGVWMDLRHAADAAFTEYRKLYGDQK